MYRHAVRALGAADREVAAVLLGDTATAGALAQYFTALRTSAATRPDRGAPWALAAARDAGLQAAAPSDALEQAQHALAARGRDGSALVAAARAAGAVVAGAPASPEAERLSGLVGAIALSRARFLPDPWMAPAALDSTARSAAAQAQRTGEWDAWTVAWIMLLEKALESAELGVARAIREMRQHRAAAYEQRRVGRTDGVVLDRLQAQPTFAIRYAADELELTTPTVGTSIERLERHGWATELTGRRRDRVWIAAPLLQLIAG